MNDRDRLVELLEKADDEQAEKNPKTMEEFYGNIADHLTANGVTVPGRCGECLYFENCNNWDGLQGIKETDYCSYGVRKENGNE